MLRNTCIGGSAPKPPGFCRLSRQNKLCCFAIGGCAPKPCQNLAGRRRISRPLAIPAAESALGLRPRIALSSAQVLPGWITLTSSCNDFSADGDYPLTSCLTPGVHFRHHQLTSVENRVQARRSSPGSTARPSATTCAERPTPRPRRARSWADTDPEYVSGNLRLDFNRIERNR